MSDACSVLSPGAGFVSSIANYIDCQSQTLGSGAWTALAAPGSTLSVMLTGFLTIVIALIGYNLLLGRTLTVRDATLAFVKIGAVLALATSWPAYRTLVYDLVTDGPAQLVAEIGPRAGVVGSDGTLLQRLDLADHALAELAILGPGTPPPNSNVELAPPPPFAGFNAFALGGSRILFLVTAVGALAAVRMVAGLMLALGPFFIAFLFFENARSLFEGWVRVLFGVALAAIGTTIALGLEVAFLEPWLSDVLARRMAGEPLPTMPTELFVISCLFTIIVLASLWGCSRVARAFRLAPLQRFASGLDRPVGGETSTHSSVLSSRTETLETERSRAAIVASALTATMRREWHDRAEVTLASAPKAAFGIANRSEDTVPGIAPVGRSFTRRTTQRVSAKAGRRDSAL